MVMVTPYRAKKGDPVAVVYYRCELLLGGKECTPRNGLYYVHNGVAVDDLPTTKGGAWVSHVAKWKNQAAVVDELYICGAEYAATFVPGTKPHCHGDTKSTAGDEQPWAVKAIYTYSVGQPITWIVDNDQDTPHNGVFKCFQRENSKDCDPDITKAGGKGTLKYWHYVNATPVKSDNEDGRTAKWWEKFTLESGSVEGDITIETRHIL